MTTTLPNIPQDILLLIIGLLQPEDCLHLIQTCKSFYSLTTVRTFWLACGKMLQRRRRVHYLPLERLDISELRTAIFHTLKLGRKWSGREGIDSSPARCLLIDPGLHLGLPAESRAVTWVWFLEDGIHLTCVVEDAVVQLWDLPRNKPILSFDVGGRLMRASQYSDKDHFVFAGSLDPEEGPNGEAVNPAFAVWKYSWDSTDFIGPLFPMALHTLPVHPTSIILNEAVVGAVYTEDPANFPVVENRDEAGYLTFLLMEWKGVCIPTRRFTPVSFFGADYTQQWASDLAFCIRTSTHLIILFDSTTGVVLYAYDWTVINDFATQHPVPGVEPPYTEMIYPRLKSTYELVSEQPTSSPSGQQLWSHVCLLWDGQKVGILGYHISEDVRRPFLSLSVLDLSPLLARDDGITHYDLQGEYARRFTEDGTSLLRHYTARNNQFLGSQPRNAANTTWVLRSADERNVISALALAQYMPQDVLQTRGEIKTPHAVPLEISNAGIEIPAIQQPPTEHEDLEIKRNEQLLQIKLEGWIPETEEAEDIDLDDHLGRVVFGMSSGKVYILEFV